MPGHKLQLATRPNGEMVLRTAEGDTLKGQIRGERDDHYNAGESFVSFVRVTFPTAVLDAVRLDDDGEVIKPYQPSPPSPRHKLLELVEGRCRSTPSSVPRPTDGR